MVVVYDSGVLPTEHTIGSILPGPPGAQELTIVPFQTLGTGNLRISATCDVAQVGGGDHIFGIYVYNPGHVLDGEFVSFATISLVVSAIGGYASYDLGFLDFTGPGIAQTVYIYPPVTFPAFSGQTYTYKNLRIIIQGDAAPSPSGGDLVYDGVAAAQFATSLRQAPRS